MSDPRRIRITVIFSVNKAREETCNFISRHLISRFGGMTVFGENQGLIGYWTNDGSILKSTYTGDISMEYVLGFFVTVVPTREKEALSEIQYVVREAISKFGLSSQYVHVETVTVYARHFEV